MIINIPSKEKTYTLTKDTLFDRTIMEYSDSVNNIDRRFGSPSATYQPKAKFGPFSKKVTFDLTIDQLNGMEVV